VVVADPAMLRDDAVNRGGDALENGIAFDNRPILQPSDDPRDISPGSVAKLPSDEGAIGVAGARATNGLRTGVSKAASKDFIQSAGAVGVDATQRIDRFGEDGVPLASRSASKPSRCSALRSSEPSTADAQARK
jgi:hypothetical protein